MDTLLDVVGAQTFLFGFLHADPHPGNGRFLCCQPAILLTKYMRLSVLVRPNPQNPKIPQVVLIDHGCESLKSMWTDILTFDTSVCDVIR
jgi:aarF domain-containing kinase